LAKLPSTFTPTRFPAYVYLPWFVVALGGVIMGAPYDAG
jgi:hypothetical protein